MAEQAREKAALLGALCEKLRDEGAEGLCPGCGETNAAGAVKSAVLRDFPHDRDGVGDFDAVRLDAGISS